MLGSCKDYSPFKGLEPIEPAYSEKPKAGNMTEVEDNAPSRTIDLGRPYDQQNKNDCASMYSLSNKHVPE